MCEVWKPIKGYEGKYSVSSKGRVKSIGRMRDNGHAQYYQKERILKPSGKPYLKVGLHNGGKVKHRHIHRLVAEAFCAKKEPGMVADHIDGDIYNNNSINLRWVSRSHNQARAKKRGGVYQYGNKYRTSIRIHTVGLIYIGTFCSRVKAEEAFKDVYLEWYGRGYVND